ncbi:MAG: response regulator [bacterium]
MDARVLVVDDEKEIVDMIVRNLKLEGYDIEGVTDPKEALEKIKEENIQVVITDIKMPRLSGVDLLKEIKKIDGIVQVIMITGYVTPSNIISSLSRGANDCLFKPLDMDRLKEAVDNSVEKLQRWQEVLGKLGGQKEKQE